MAKQSFKRDIYYVGGVDVHGPYVKVGMAGDPEARTADSYGHKHLLHTFTPIKDGSTRIVLDGEIQQWLDKHAKGVLYRPDRGRQHGREIYRFSDPELLQLYQTSTDIANKHGVFWLRVLKLLERYTNEWKHGVNGCSASYPMRPEQSECVNKAVDWFDKGHTSFLIAAKMRFGKTHVSYQIASKGRAKNVLVVAFTPQAKSSWKDDLEHIKFAGSHYHDYKGGAPVLGQASGMDVCFVSMQSLTTGNVLPDRAWVFAIEWDYIIIDEEHIGTATLKSTDVFSRIKHRREIWVSGTPFRDVTLGKFSDDNTFAWTYVDEQEAKTKELHKIDMKFDVRETSYQALPKMTMRAIFPANEHKTTLNEMCTACEKGDMPSLAKVFAANASGQFEHPSQARAIIAMLELELSAGGFFDTRSLDHILAYIPGVKEATLIENLVKERPFFRDYLIINATGNGENDIEVAKQRAVGEPKTLVLTCRRWCEAVTVPQWGTVVLLDEIRSPAQFWQTVFRVQGPFIDSDYHKRECYVIAFSLDMLLSQVYQLAYFTRKQDQKLEDSIKRILDAIPIYGSHLTKLTKIPFDQAFKQGLKITEDVAGMFNGSSAIGSVNISAEFLTMLQANVPGMDAIVSRVEQALHHSGIAKGNVSQRSKPNAKSIADPAVMRANRLLNALRSLERLIPRYMYASETQSRTLGELLSPSTAAWDARFKSYMGIDKQEFNQLVKCGAFDVRSLDDKIAAFSTVEDAIRSSR